MMQGSAQADSLVKVFIRTKDKKARGLLLPSHISANQLKKIAGDKTHIPLEFLILFNQGREIQQEAQLQNNNIIHAIDLRNVHTDNIHLYVKLLDQKAAREKYAINTNTLIKDFINDNLLRLYEVALEDVFLVYTGRQVDIQKNFKEELIENESEVICVKVKSLQHKTKDQDKVEHKVDHVVSPVQGEHKQEHHDNTIRIATKVAKLKAEDTEHVLKGGKDHHAEQTEVIVSMKEVEENQQHIHEKVAQLHQGNVETEQQGEVITETVPEDNATGVAHHEELSNNVEHHPVLHSSAPVEQTGNFQINLEQPKVLDIYAEATKTQQEQPRIQFQFKEAQVDQLPVEESTQALKNGHIDHLKMHNQQQIAHIESTQSKYMVDSANHQPQVHQQIQEHAVEEIKESIASEEKVVQLHQAEDASVPVLNTLEQQRHQQSPKGEVNGPEEQSESPHIIEIEHITEKLQTKTIEEEQYSMQSEVRVQGIPPVEQGYENKETVQNEYIEAKQEEPVAPQINLQTDQQVHTQQADTVTTHAHPILQGVLEEPALHQPNTEQQQPVHPEDDHLLDQTQAQQQTPIHATPQQILTQNKLTLDEPHAEITLKSEALHQEHKSDNIQIEQAKKEQSPFEELKESQLAALNGQKLQAYQKAAVLNQHEEAVVQHPVEEPIKVQENKPQDSEAREHKITPTLEVTYHLQHQERYQDVAVEAQNAAQDQIIKGENENTPVLQSQPVHFPKQIEDLLSDKLVQDVETEKIVQHSQETLHQDKVSSPVVDIVTIQQQTTHNNEAPAAISEVPLEQEVKPIDTLQAVHDQAVVVEEVRQQIHDRITQTVQIIITEIPIIIESQQTEVPVAVENQTVVENERLVLHSQVETQQVTGNVVKQQHANQQQIISKPEVVEDKQEPVQHVAELQGGEDHRNVRIDHTINVQQPYYQGDIPISRSTYLNAEVPIDGKTHQNEQPIMQQEIPTHHELQEIHIGQAETIPSNQQNLQEETTVEAKLQQPASVPVVESHSEIQAAAEHALTSHQAEKLELEQQETGRQKGQSDSKLDLGAENTHTPIVKDSQFGEQAPHLKETPVAEVEVGEAITSVQNMPVVSADHQEHNQIGNGSIQPAIVQIQEHHQAVSASIPQQIKLQNETDYYIKQQAINHQEKLEDNVSNMIEKIQEADNNLTHEDKLDENHQSQPNVQHHSNHHVLESAPQVIIQQHVEHSPSKPTVPQLHESSKDKDNVNEANPIQHEGVEEIESSALAEKPLAETGHQWEIKDQPCQSVPIFLQQKQEQFQKREIPLHNQPINKANIQQQSHRIDLKEDADKEIKAIQEIKHNPVHQVLTICPESKVEPRCEDPVQHHEAVINIVPALQTAIIDAQQAVADHKEDIQQKGKGHSSDPQQQQVPLIASVLKQSERNLDEVYAHLQEAKVQHLSHDKEEVPTLHEQQITQELPNNYEAIGDAHIENQPPIIDEAHVEVAALHSEAPVEQQAVPHQQEIDVKVVVDDMPHEAKEADHHAPAQPIQNEPEHVAQEQTLQANHQQYSQLPYVSSSQLPLSQNTSSSFANISHNNLEIIAHLKLEAPTQSRQKGVAFEELKVKSPHSTTNECLIYQEQLIHKSGNQQISIVHQTEEIPDERAQIHAAPAPVQEHAEPSLIDNINQEEPLSVIEVNEPTD